MKLSKCLNCNIQLTDEMRFGEIGRHVDKAYFCSMDCAKKYYEKNKIVKEKLDETKFNEILHLHENTLLLVRNRIKNRLFGVPEGTHTELLETVKEQGKVLSLLNARCRCEKCQTTENLTIHHLLTRRVKNFMEFNRYLIQRYFYANIVVLCVKCHTEFHVNERDWNESLSPINPMLIEQLKEEFYLKEKNE